MYVSRDVLLPLSAAERLQLRAVMNTLAGRAAARFLKAVRPIYAVTHSGEPNHIGSSILLDVRGTKVLLTAAHIVDQNQEMGSVLYVGGEGGFVEIDADFFATAKPDGDRDNDRYDFAAAQLPTKMLDGLEDGFVSERDITTQVEPGHLYTALGFPNSQNKGFDRRTGKKVAKGVRYSSTTRINDVITRRLSGQGQGEHHVFLGYHKHSRTEEGVKVSSIEPRGLSGGAIIDAGRPTDLQVFREEHLPIPRLVGMIVERWKEHQVLVGTRLAVILPEIKARLIGPTVGPG